MSRVDILEAGCGTLPWVIAVVLIYLECHWMLPSIPTRGHGLVLLLLVTISLVFETLALLSWFSPLWWWTVRKYVTFLVSFIWHCTVLSLVNSCDKVTVHVNYTSSSQYYTVCICDKTRLPFSQMLTVLRGVCFVILVWTFLPVTSTLSPWSLCINLI